MDFLYLKSLHIIFVITYFSGLFYIVRLFIYQVEANDKPSPEKEILQKQLKMMSKRLWHIITIPSAILATIFAVWMLVQNPAYLQMPWMHVKLTFVFLLIIYHFICDKIFKELQNDIIKYSSQKLRIWNEIATIILFSIVFLVTLKNAINWIWGVVGIVSLSVLLMLGIKLYKRIREKK